MDFLTVKRTVENLKFIDYPVEGHCFSLAVTGDYIAVDRIFDLFDAVRRESVGTDSL
mgnify:CR=1 FL=1